MSDKTDGVYIKSDGKTLKAYKIVRKPAVIMQHVPGHSICPGMNQIMTEQEAGELLRDLKEKGYAQVLKNPTE